MRGVFWCGAPETGSRGGMLNIAGKGADFQGLVARLVSGLRSILVLVVESKCEDEDDYEWGRRPKTPLSHHRIQRLHRHPKRRLIELVGLPPIADNARHVETGRHRQMPRSNGPAD